MNLWMIRLYDIHGEFVEFVPVGPGQLCGFCKQELTTHMWIAPVACNKVADK